MQKNVMFRWFVRGFAITLLVMAVVLVAAKAPSVLAQTGGPNNSGDAINPGAGVDSANLSNNVDTVAVSSNGLTDDPLGRTLIPLPEGQSPDLNTAAVPAGDSIVITSMDEAQSIEGSSEDYVSPLIVPAADFRDDGYNPIGSMFFSFLGGSLTNDSNGTSSCVMAPAYLPHGSTVYEMWTSYKDYDPDSDAWLNLYRLDHYSGVVDIMASVATSGSSGAMINPVDFTIDFPSTAWDWAYYLGGCGASDLIYFYSARIWYTTP